MKPVSNQSRSYDARRQGVRFWGQDDACEVSFLLEEDTLTRIELQFSGAARALAPGVERGGVAIWNWPPVSTGHPA